MVKKGYIECEKCGKAMKKTAKRGHKCETLDPNRPKTCPNCLQEVSTNIFAMHAKDCESMPLDEMPDPDLNEIKKTAAIFYNFKNKATNNYKCNIKYVIKK